METSSLDEESKSIRCLEKEKVDDEKMKEEVHEQPISPSLQNTESLKLKSSGENGSFSAANCASEFFQLICGYTNFWQFQFWLLGSVCGLGTS